MKSSLTLIIWLAIATILLTFLLSRLVERRNINDVITPGIEESASNSGIKSITANLMVDDMDKMITWYSTYLGFQIEKTDPANKPYTSVKMKNGNVCISFETRESFMQKFKGFKYKTTGGALSFYLQVDNIQELFEKLKVQMNLNTEIIETSNGNLEFTLRDPAGNILIITG